MKSKTNAGGVRKNNKQISCIKTLFLIQEKMI